MISGLATCTPTVVVGWSHKYAEVMSEFDMEDLVLRFETIDDDILWNAYAAADSNDAQLRTLIAAGLPAATRQAEVNLDVIRDVLASR